MSRQKFIASPRVLQALFFIAVPSLIPPLLESAFAARLLLIGPSLRQRNPKHPASGVSGWLPDMSVGQRHAFDRNDHRLRNSAGVAIVHRIGRRRKEHRILFAANRVASFARRTMGQLAVEFQPPDRQLLVIPEGDSDAVPSAFAAD